MSVRSAIAGLLLTLAGTAQAAGPYGEIVVGNWSGGAYTNDKTGLFSHCAVNAGYKNGTRMLTSVTSDFRWILGLSHPDWKLNVGARVPLRLVFDRSSRMDVTAEVRTRELITMAMPSESALIRAFRQASYLEVIAGDKRLTFALTSTSEMLPALVNCVRGSANIRGPVAPAPGAPADPKVAAEKKATLETARNLIRGKMLACVGREGSSMMLTDEKAEAVAKAAMIFCRTDVDALVQATIELTELENNRPADRGAVRAVAEQRVLEVVTAYVIRSRGDMLSRRNQTPQQAPVSPQTGVSPSL